MLSPPPGPRWATPSGRIELVNPAEPEPVPRHLPTYADAGGPPLRLVTAPALHTLNSTFMERPDLRERSGGMALKLSPGGGARPRASRTGSGSWPSTRSARRRSSCASPTASRPGWRWPRASSGSPTPRATRNVNALTSQRLTDRGAGSTFYDNRVDVRAG